MRQAANWQCQIGLCVMRASKSNLPVGQKECGSYLFVFVLDSRRCKIVELLRGVLLLRLCRVQLIGARRK